MALLLAPAALADDLPDLGDVAQTMLSPTQERMLGEDIMRQMRADPSYSDDPEVVDYLDTLGRRLAAGAPDSHQEFNFFLVRDPQINAFALPGGWVGVNSGLLMAAQSESELAGVLGHEISHVLRHHIARQMALQKQTMMLSLAGMALAILASRGNGDVSQAAILGSQAAAVQAQLSYSRDFEREADRSGFQLLERAGFDPQAMATFFGRLQKATRFENAAPAYLQSHPLTYERIADMQNLAQDAPYRQVPDSIEFQLVRAKLKVESTPPREAVAFFEDSLKEKRFLSETASLYGLTSALMLAKDYPRAKQELEKLRKKLRANPMVDALAGQLYDEAGDTDIALRIYSDALQAYPGNRTLTYDYGDALLRHNQPETALKLAEQRLQFASSDYRLYRLQSRSYGALGYHLLQHRAEGEAYFYQGDVKSAVEQMELAQKSDDGDYYQRATVDARLRQLRALLPDDDSDRQPRRRGG